MSAERNPAVTGILAGACFGVAMMGGHLWAVTRAAHAAPDPNAPIVVAVTAQAGAGLLLPVEGIPTHHLRNSFDDARGARPHAALDIAAPRDALVRAVADGTVARLSASARGGTAVEQLDAAGEHCYYYAHLARYASGLREGRRVRRGQVLGHVGTTGNAPPDAPHLHFAMFRLGPDRRCWTGTPVNPYPLFSPAVGSLRR